MKKSIKPTAALALGALLLGATPGYSQITVTVDPVQTWNGFMNVFETPANGGAYVFGQTWGTADLTATFAGSVLTLGPNTIGDPSSFWYTPAGGPGAVGNKTMDASMYVQSDGPFAGQTLTFTGDVLQNTLQGQTALNGSTWTTMAFIKDFAPDFSSSVTVLAPLDNGIFNISLALISDPARHVQYGFETIGSDVWATDVGSYGTVTIAPVPEPSICALAALGGFGMFAGLRRKKA